MSYLVFGTPGIMEKCMDTGHRGSRDYKGG